MVPCEGTFYHSLRHARKDLLSKWFATHEGSNWLICFIGFDKAIIRCSLSDCWHVRHLQNLLCMMQAWGKNTEPHSQSRALGLRKMEPRRLERQKCLRCGAEKHAVPRCIEAPPALFTTKIPFFSVKQWMPRWVKTWSGRPFAYMLCSLSWRLSVLQPLVESMPDATKTTRGGQEHVKEKVLLFSIAVPLWCGYVEQKKWWTVHFSVAWNSEIGWA